MLASMSATEWSELAVSGLPTGTVTLLLADVEGSTRLWETQPDEMTVAIARLDSTLADLVETHGGVRPIEQGEGDSFVLAFARASESVWLARAKPVCVVEKAGICFCVSGWRAIPTFR